MGPNGKWLVVRVVVLLVSLTIVSAGCGVFKLEAEAFKSKGRVVKSNSASGGRAVHLGIGQKHQMFFCLQRETEVAIQQIIYLNGGKPKSVVVHMDGIYLDLLETGNTTTCSRLQSNYLSQRGSDETMKLARGRHVVRMQVTSGDRYGIDIDMIVLKVLDTDLRWETFRCRSFCNSEIPFAPTADSLVKDAIVPAKAVQRSYQTQCAEADNVKILLFHDNVKRYNIRARHPAYHTLANYREPDFNKCTFTSSLLWEVKDIRFSKSNFKHADRSVRLETVLKNRLEFEMTSRFRLRGRAEGMNDHDVGNKLTVDVMNVMARLYVRVMIYGRESRWKTISTRNLTSGRLHSLKWNIPDYSWHEVKENALKVTFIGDKVFNAKVSNIKLEKRLLKRDRSFSIYDDENVIVECVKIDMWWLREAMTITVEGSDRTWEAHYFRLSFPVPWSDGFSQVFVMYQDGNVRILPSTPHGTDWIPFGSSVLTGQVNTSHLRPAAEIFRVHITPDAQEMTVFYKDGGVKLISLEVTMDETIAHVRVLRLGRDPMLFPFVSFRSMWVKDGNSDVDHVSANGLRGHHILEQWGTIYGHSFSFYRQCISKHNTQSPDINIEIVE